MATPLPSDTGITTAQGLLTGLTPKFAAAGTSTFTTFFSSGFYTQVGRVYTVQFFMQFTLTKGTGSGSFFIDGLPAGLYQSLAIRNDMVQTQGAWTSLGAGYTKFVPTPDPGPSNDTKIAFLVYNPATSNPGQALISSNMSDGFYRLDGSIVYYKTT